MYPLISYIDTNMPFDELVRAEAVFNCKVKKWCGFLCLLCQQLHIPMEMFLYYPDFDSKCQIE